jgi:hypothetical protein
MTIVRYFASSRAAVLLLMACLLGCVKSDYRTRYVPSPDVAHHALSLALEAWRQGDRTHLALDETTVVEVIDKHRRLGQRLANFNILGDISVDGGRWFEVELRLASPAQIEQVRYCVIGINPLWVFRQPDYEQVAHWDHPMAEPATP